MGVGHGLRGVGAGVEDDAVPALRHSLGHRDGVGFGRHLLQETAAGLRDGSDIGIMFSRYYQDVGGRLRIDIAERDGPSTFPNAFSGDVTGDDPAEQTVIHAWILSPHPRTGP